MPAIENRLQALVEFDRGSDPAIRKWTGGYDLTYGGETYDGKVVFAVGDGGGSSLTGQQQRLGIRIGVTESERQTFLRDLGAPPVTVTLIVSDDGGATWTVVDTIKGRVGAPTLRGRTYSFTVEPRTPVVDQGRVGRWSHEDRQRTHPGDQGMKQLARLAESDVVIGWPAVLDRDA